MPVDNHPVHERTKTDDSFRYGCNNHPKRGGGYWAPNRRYTKVDGCYSIVYEYIKTDWIDYESCPAAHDHIGCTGCKHKGVI